MQPLGVTVCFAVLSMARLAMRCSLTSAVFGAGLKPPIGRRLLTTAELAVGNASASCCLSVAPFAPPLEGSRYVTPRYICQVMSDGNIVQDPPPSPWRF